MDRQRNAERHTRVAAKRRLAPVTQGVETPGLKAILAQRAPGKRINLTIAALHVGLVEIEPAPAGKRPALVGTGVAAAVGRTEIGRQRFTRLRQPGKHRLTPLNVRGALLRSHRINAQRVERMALWRYQVPAAIALLGAKEAARLKRHPTGPACKLVLRRALGQPGIQLLLLLGHRLLQLLVALDLARPVGPRVLAVTVDDASIGRRRELLTAHPKLADQNMLRSFRLRHGQGHGADLAQVQRPGNGVRQQQPLTLVRPGHRHTGAHALVAGRRGLQGH